jgi:hypothetical protein
MENLEGSLPVHLGQHAKLRHHEYAVNGKLCDAKRLEGINHHQGRLLAPWGMGQDAAASNYQAHFPHVHNGLSGELLLKDFGDSALLLDALQADSQLAVVGESKPQRFPGHGLLHKQLL